MWNPDYQRKTQADYLTEARGMTLDTLQYVLRQLENLSDDPSEGIATAGMQMKYACYKQVLDEKIAKSNKPPLPTHR